MCRAIRSALSENEIKQCFQTAAKRLKCDRTPNKNGNTIIINRITRTVSYFSVGPPSAEALLYVFCRFSFACYWYSLRVGPRNTPVCDKWYEWVVGVCGRCMLFLSIFLAVFACLLSKLLCQTEHSSAQFGTGQIYFRVCVCVRAYS